MTDFQLKFMPIVSNNKCQIPVASMADKTRGRMRILSYGDANRHRRDLLELATAGFMRLVQVIFMTMKVLMMTMTVIIMKMAVIIFLLEFNKLAQNKPNFPEISNLLVNSSNMWQILRC